MVNRRDLAVDLALYSLSGSKHPKSLPLLDANITKYKKIALTT